MDNVEDRVHVVHILYMTAKLTQCMHAESYL